MKEIPWLSLSYGGEGKGSCFNLPQSFCPHLHTDGWSHPIWAPPGLYITPGHYPLLSPCCFYFPVAHDCRSLQGPSHCLKPSKNSRSLSEVSQSKPILMANLLVWQIKAETINKQRQMKMQFLTVSTGYLSAMPRVIKSSVLTQNSTFLKKKKPPFEIVQLTLAFAILSENPWEETKGTVLSWTCTVSLNSSTAQHMTLLHVPSPAASTASGLSDTVL